MYFALFNAEKNFLNVVKFNVTVTFIIYICRIYQEVDIFNKVKFEGNTNLESLRIL